MTTTTIDRYPVGRFEWERLIRRITMTEREKLVCLLLATYADPNGTRVRPGELVLANVIGKSERTVRRVLSTLENKFRIIELVARGGGRGPSARTSEYRLTMPVDLLDRVEILAPGDRQNTATPDNLVSGVTPPSPVDAPVDNPLTPDTHLSGESYPQPPKTPETPDNLLSGESRKLRTDNTVSDRNSGQNRRNSGQPGCPTTKDQPPKATNLLPDTQRNSRPRANDHETITVPPRQRSPHDRPASALEALATFTPTVRRRPPSTQDSEP